MNPNFADIGTSFVQLYYSTFDTNRAALASVYTDQSMLTFEGEQRLGAAAIVDKLTNLQFQTVKHEWTTIDSQPSVGNGVVTYVTGNLAVDNDFEHPMKFSQVFHLMPHADGSGFFVLNDLFRLNLC
eukprot:gnl/Hemi2/2569_TR911_c0_g1_i1.p2 gnl/Hemi2/2569_TR911_c0_g1~~gnl/Hemi2/2569_TR911_c0_g1_i1.p2  ORF type:complete len:148 (+),score=50.17 gnl/Hemi2/2569_TR911_c0_g1_i1:66-446(+)